MDFFNIENNKTPFNNYSLNGCCYIFKDIYKDDKNNYYKLIKSNKYSKITPKRINQLSYITLTDINNNKINIII